MIDIQGYTLTPEDKMLIQHVLVSGIILFSRNYQSLQQLKKLTRAIKAQAALAKKPCFWIFTDHEGGRVQRFKREFTVLPAMSSIGKLYDNNPENALKTAEQIGKTMGKELRATGIDGSFAPVLDIHTGISTVIGDRSFHADPIVVAQLGYAVFAGMYSENLIGVGKHFPGHGQISADSHTDISIDHRDFQAIQQTDLLAFAYFIAQVNQHKIPANRIGIMPAHIIYDQCDAYPAGFSAFWLKTILRRQLHYQGLIFSDDLCMRGAEPIGDMIHRVQKAKRAGCDMLLICNNRPAVLEILQHITDIEAIK